MPADDPSLKVLVTGSGGSAAVNFLRMVHRTDVTWFAADIER